MNRYRLNQILETLLFPMTDPALASVDPLLLCYQAYRDFMERVDKMPFDMQERNKKDRRYKSAQKELADYIVGRNQGRVKSKDDIQMLCDYFYPMTDIEQVMRRINAVQAVRGFRYSDIENMSCYYVRSMERISRSLITYRDGVASIKQWTSNGETRGEADIFNSSGVFNKVEIWNLLCRITVPDIYIAIAAAEYDMGMMALYEQKANISLSDKLLKKRISKGLAENHLHFNVGFDYMAVWLPYMNLDFIEEVRLTKWGRAEYIRLEMAIFRYVAACFLMKKEGKGKFEVWIENNVSMAIKGVLRDLYNGNYEKKLEQELISAVYRLRTYTADTSNKYDYLLNEIYGEYVEYKTSSEFILLYQSYQYIKQNEYDTFYARMFLQYLRLKNEYFSKSHENHVMQGLVYFQESYNTTKRHASTVLSEKELMIEIFRSQALISNLKKLEIRIAPKVDGITLDIMHYTRSRKEIHRQLYDQIYQIFCAYRQYILESAVGIRAAQKILAEREGLGNRRIQNDVLDMVRESNVNIPTLGIVFHFLKSEHLEDRSGNYCWRTILNGEEHHTAYRMLKRIYTENVACALEEIREKIPRLSEYIVGIDAASDENAAEPWMFSPAYKVFRSQEHTRPVMDQGSKIERFGRIQNIGFTYHVGEEFRHIISGLRHIDEVVEQFGYMAGDRLGHALALGIDVEQWMKDNEVVPIPMLEHLENLLWMWGINTCQGFSLPIKLEVLEHKIMELVVKLYEFPETISIRMLYAAYKKKFDTDHRLIAKQMLEENDKAGCPMCYGNSRDEEKCGYWTVEHLLLTNYCPVYEEKYEKIELVSVSLDELDLCQKLQEYMIHKVEQKGIYIEANPTSNLTIGDFSYMHYHPIFRLNSVDKEHEKYVFVTINSDDPAVFNTNIENELAYIYYAAEAQGVSKSEIIEWVDQIRQYGMEASFVQCEKDVIQILMEVEEIMNKIEGI